MKILAVDPGITGAYALLYSDGAMASVHDLPVVDKHLAAAEFLRQVQDLKIDQAVVESVSAMPGQGVSSTFVFGRVAGAINATIACAGIPLVFVQPAKWKKHFNLGGKDKDGARRLAIQRFPNVQGLSLVKNHNRAEALLIGLHYLETR